jgi:hypothetical protein
VEFVWFCRIIFLAMTNEADEPLVQELLDELREWCRAERGRQTAIARELRVSRQLVTDWLANRSTPTLGAGLRLQAFLRHRSRRRIKDQTP